MSVIVLRISLVLFIVLLVLLFILRKRDKSRLDASIFTGKRKNSDLRYLKILYRKLEGFPLTKRYVLSMHRIFEAYYPSDEDLIITSTMKLIGVTAGLSVIIISTVLIAAPSFYMFASCLILIYVLAQEIIASVIGQNDRKVLDELNNFIDLLQFNFLQTGMVDEAIHDAIVGKNKLIERHAAQILKVLDSENLEEAVDQYMISVQNKYLKELACICVTVFLYGDTEIENESCFLRNLKKLKDRISTEGIQQTEKNYRFRGLSVICIPPLFAATYLSNWASSQVPELEAYFSGYYGLVLSLLCPIVCMVTNIFVTRLKSDGAPDLSDHDLLNQICRISFIHRMLTTYFNNNYGKELQYSKLLKQTGSKLNVYTLTVKRWLFAILTIVFSITTVCGMHFYTKNHITSEITGTGSKSSAASEEDSVIMMMLIKAYTDKYLEEDVVGLYNVSAEVTARSFNRNVEEFLKNRVIGEMQNNSIEINEEDALRVILQYNTEHSSSTKLYTAFLGSTNGPIREENDAMYAMGQEQLFEIRDKAQEPAAIEIEVLCDSIATDVVNRVSSYQNSFLHWYEVTVCLLLGILAFHVPYLWILMNKRATQQLMETEVLQFQSLILVLMQVPQMSSQLIMDWMLKFSQIFRSEIHRCIINLPADELKAFEDLIAAEPFEPFQDLIRKLEMCDRVGVKQAFSSLEVVQNNYIERNKQITKQRIATNSSTASFLVYVPVIFVLVMYMIYPLLAESMGQLTSTMSQMSSM